MQLQAPTIVTKIIPLTLFKVFKNTRLGKAYFLKRNYHFESEFALDLLRKYQASAFSDAK
jgi:hypothetical protein